MDPDPVQERPASARRRWRYLRWGAAAVAALLVLPQLTAGTWLWVVSLGAPDERVRGTGQDAVWLGHAWVDGRRGPDDVAALAQRVRRGGVRDLFVHSGPLADDGTLDPALHPRAGWAVGALRAALPGVRVQAWLGQRVDPGRLDLADGAVRTRITGAARTALDLGFDGVHYNFEPVPDGHAGLLDLLERTRALTAARGAVLSMSAHHVEPLPGMSTLDDLVIGHTKWWSPGYLAQVAHRVDQVAVMSYDTGLPTQALYAGYVREQTETALEAVPPGTTLLMGLPAYHSDTIAHRSSAETVAAALRGVRLGLDPTGGRRFGVGLYVDFAATDSDWDSYYTDWAAPGRG